MLQNIEVKLINSQKLGIVKLELTIVEVRVDYWKSSLENPYTYRD
jgi:hypothetical protein